MVLRSLLPRDFRHGPRKTSNLVKTRAQANGSSAEAFRVGKKHLQSERGSYSGLAVSALLLGLRALEKALCPISRFS